MNDYSNMSIYKKIQLVKQKLLKANLKKTGENKYAGFKYYELADFTPTIIELCTEVGLFTKITFTEELATLKIINSDKPEQVETYTSPMRSLVLKGCNEIQALGGVETYSRRYLYMSAFDIIEQDMFDSMSNNVLNNVANNVANQAPKKETKATNTQVEKIKTLYTEEEITKALGMVKKEKLEDLSVKEASSLIAKRMQKKEEVSVSE